MGGGLRSALHIDGPSRASYRMAGMTKDRGIALHSFYPHILGKAVE